MSWKLRRAHYYQRQRGGSGADAGISKWINFWLLIGISLIFIFLIIAGSGFDIDENPILAFLSVLGLLSLLGTPFLFILACLADTLKHGLPNFAAGTTRTTKTNSKIVNQKRKQELDENVQRWEEILKKAMKDPDYPLFDNQYVSVKKTHEARLKKFGRSNYRGIHS